MSAMLTTWMKFGLSAPMSTLPSSPVPITPTRTGLPSDFTNNVRARSVDECWFAHDKGVGVVADFPTETVVTYTRHPQTLRGVAQIYRSGELLKTVDMPEAVPQNFAIYIDHDGNDTWVATGKGLGQNVTQINMSLEAQKTYWLGLQ